MTRMEAINRNGRDGDTDPTGGLPLVIALNFLDDYRFEEETLRDITVVQHVELSCIEDRCIELAMAVLLHSLAYLPQATQRRLQLWQLILCLSSLDKVVDSQLTSNLALELLHIDKVQAEEVADTIMALLLELIRHTHLLSKQGFSSSS